MNAMRHFYIVIAISLSFLFSINLSAQYFFYELTEPSGTFTTEVAGQEWVEIEINTGFTKPLLIKLEYNLNYNCCFSLYGKPPSAGSLFAKCGAPANTFTTIIYDTGGNNYNAYINFKGEESYSYGTLKVFYSHLDEDLSNFQLQYGYDLAGNRTSVGIHEISIKAESVLDENPLAEHFFGPREIKVYPNPTRGDLNIEILNGDDDEEYLYMVFDMNGRKIMEYSNTGNGTVPLNLHGQNSGTYVVIVRTTDGNLQYKIIKE